jgi:hypothetical protein
MERLLLLWDEMDELYGAARHLVAQVRHDLRCSGREALALVGGWAGAAQARLRLTLRGNPART